MTAFRDEVLADTPAIFLTLDETSGQHVDLSGNGHDSTAVSVAAQGTADPGVGWAGVGTGDDFNGTASYVSVPDSDAFYPGAGGFTVELVAAIDTLDVNYRRIASHESATDGWNLTAVDSGVGQADRGWRIERRAANASFNVSFLDSPTTGAVRHVVGVFDPSPATPTMTLFVNGAQKVQNAAAVGAMANPAAALALGARSADITRFFDGRIYHFAYYPAALSSSRIAAHYAAVDAAYVAPAAGGAKVRSAGAWSDQAAQARASGAWAAAALKHRSSGAWA